jgi:hypothetical protein
MMALGAMAAALALPKMYPGVIAAEVPLLDCELPAVCELPVWELPDCALMLVAAAEVGGSLEF